jgi:hypothetical protein
MGFMKNLDGYNRRIGWMDGWMDGTTHGLTTFYASRRSLGYYGHCILHFAF